VVTGTLWSGPVSRGDQLVVLPQRLPVRVRAVQVHDEPVETALAGQRVALNLAGVQRSAVARGDVVSAADDDLAPSFRVDAALDFADGSSPLGHGARVQVHHGTREAPARLAQLGGRFWQVRLEQPLIPAPGDHLVVRQIAPPDTLGGGVVLDAHPRRHGPGRDVIARLSRRLRGEPDPAPATPGRARKGPAPPPKTPPAPLSDAAQALESRLRACWFEPPIESELTSAEAAALAELRDAGRAVRVGRSLHYHPDALAELERRVVESIQRHGSITLAGLRDELGTSRKFAQALLEHLDATRVTRRLPGDERVLRRRG
jgi:selenocysteine-specific elongation factor